MTLLIKSRHLDRGPCKLPEDDTSAGDDPKVGNLGLECPSTAAVYCGDVGYWNGIMRTAQFEATVEPTRGPVSKRVRDMIAVRPHRFAVRRHRFTNSRLRVPKPCYRLAYTRNSTNARPRRCRQPRRGLTVMLSFLSVRVSRLFRRVCPMSTRAGLLFGADRDDGVQQAAAKDRSALPWAEVEEHLERRVVAGPRKE